MRLIFKGCLVVLISNFSYANNKVGNGGNVVQCSAPKLQTVLLDFYEHNISPQASKIKAQQIAEEFLKRLESAAPELSKQYLKRLNQIFADIQFAEKIQIVDIPDSKHLFRPLSADCKIIQIAVRNNMAIEEDKKFLIRKDLWDELKSEQQAGLLTHEIIHEHFTKLGEENSIKARRVNAFLYGKDLKGKEFWKLIKELELPIYP